MRPSIPRRPTAPPRLATALLLLLGGAPTVWAWRCNGRLIEPGHSFYEVRSLCGDPASAEHQTEWRLQTVYQQQCQTVMEPRPLPSKPGPASAAGSPSSVPRTVCMPVPISYSVPVDIEVWFYDDVSVPKALHFEAGRLAWIETLWHLRH